MSVDVEAAYGARGNAAVDACDLRTLLPELVPKLHRIIGTQVDLTMFVPSSPCRVAVGVDWTSRLVIGLVSVARAHIDCDGWMIVSARTAGADRTMSTFDDGADPGYAVVTVSLNDE
jgi:hypothetical protein